MNVDESQTTNRAGRLAPTSGYGPSRSPDNTVRIQGVSFLGSTLWTDLALNGDVALTEANAAVGMIDLDTPVLECLTRSTQIVLIPTLCVREAMPVLDGISDIRITIGRLQRRPQPYCRDPHATDPLRITTVMLCAHRLHVVAEHYILVAQV